MPFEKNDPRLLDWRCAFFVQHLTLACVRYVCFETKLPVTKCLVDKVPQVRRDIFESPAKYYIYYIAASIQMLADEIPIKFIEIFPSSGPAIDAVKRSPSIRPSLQAVIRLLTLKYANTQTNAANHPSASALVFCSHQSHRLFRTKMFYFHSFNHFMLCGAKHLIINTFRLTVESVRQRHSVSARPIH